MQTATRVGRPHIKRNDIVIAISGEDAAGRKQGKVLHVMAGQGMAIVEGFNMVKRHMKKSQDNPEGGIVEKEAALPISKLRIYLPEKDKAAPKPVAEKKIVEKKAAAEKKAPAKKAATKKA